MEDVQAPGARLTFVGGELIVHGWPATVPAPPMLRAYPDGSLRGPARLRAQSVRALAAAGAPFRDEVAPAPVTVAPPADLPPAVAAIAARLPAPARAVVAGLDLADRALLVHATVAAHAAPALLVVPDTGPLAAFRAQFGPGLAERTRELREGAPGAALTLATAAGAAREIARLGRRHELLVVDGLELWAMPQLQAVVDGSAALHRLGFLASAQGADVLARSRGIGPVLAVRDDAAAPRLVELRLPLTASERAGYEAAWHEFFRAFDRFCAMRPGAGFAAFVRWARGEGAARPALLAWHRCLRTAGWTAAKTETVADLLARHRGQRVLVFTPDRTSAYEIARANLVMPVTAELPRGERDAALRAFARGELRALVGPRLLATGAPEAAADVGIAVGCSQGQAQEAARRRRIAAAGTFYELLSLDTLEVGRARRQRGTAAAAPAGLD